MPTIPTGQMERELRRMYLRWVELDLDEIDLLALTSNGENA